MSDKRENIRTNNLESFLLILLMAISLQLFHKTDSNTSHRNNNQVPDEISIRQNNTTVCSGIQVQYF